MLTGDLIEPGFRLTAPHHAGLHDHVEEPDHLVVFLGMCPLVDRLDVVGEQGGGQPGRTAPYRLDHLGPELAVEGGQHPGGVDLEAERRRLGIEQVGEAGPVHLVALQSGPGVLVRVGGVEEADGPGGQTGLGLVGGERLEGTGGDNPAEVEQHGVDHDVKRRDPTTGGPSQGHR